MGMLFNTDGTQEILKRLNEAFNAAGLQRLKTANTGNVWSQAFADIGTVQGGNRVLSYNTIARPLGIDLDVGSPTTGLRSHNWQKWLKYIDTHVNTGSTNSVSTDIGAKIGTAITQANPPYSQVEFFATPAPPDKDDTSYLYVTATTQDYTDAYGNLSLIVTVNTCTVDQLP